MACHGWNRGLAFAAPSECGGGGDMALRMPGRPKDLEKREAILDAAQVLFAQRGFDGCPIEAIAAQSGVSKVTVYANFGDKSKILDAIVTRETGRLALSLSRAEAEGATLEERLVSFGQRLVEAMTDPAHMAMDRCISLEAQRNPEMGRRFFAAGPGRVIGLLGAVMAEAVARGELGACDPDQAARDLLGLWLGFTAIERRLCGSCEIDAVGLGAHIERTTRMYLAACRAVG